MRMVLQLGLASLFLMAMAHPVVARVTTATILGTVETTQSAVAGLVDDRQIRDLPLNGRDFLQLALLEPGVSNVTVASSEISKGFGAKLSFAGARPHQTSFLLVGTDIVYDKRRLWRDDAHLR